VKEDLEALLLAATNILAQTAVIDISRSGDFRKTWDVDIRLSNSENKIEERWRSLKWEDVGATVSRALGRISEIK